MVAAPSLDLFSMGLVGMGLVSIDLVDIDRVDMGLAGNSSRNYFYESLFSS